MKKRNKTKVLIVFLAVIILIITSCFIFTIFKLQRVKEKKSNFKIEYTKINKVNPIKAGNYDPTSKATITNKGLSLDMSFDLYSPNDEITYNVTIKNIGDIKGKIVNVIAVPDYSNDDNAAKLIDPVTVTTTDVVGKELSPGDEINMQITVSYPITKNKVNPVNVPYQLSLLTTTLTS